MIVGDQTLPIENALETSLLQLQYAAQYYHEEGQYRIFLRKIASKIQVRFILEINIKMSSV